MKISIITPTYNSADTIKDTLESILNQNYKNIEHIIIDGNSSDETKEIIRDYTNLMSIKFVSEKDDGLYDAMNKGINMATGEIITILNSDDFYKNNDVVEKIITIFEKNPKIDGVYGDLEIVNRNEKNKIIRNWKSGELTDKKINSGWMIPHPTFFIRKNIYDNLDKKFDLSLKIAADYEFMLRLIKIYNINCFYLPETIVSMRDGGKSGINLSNRIIGWKEIKLAWEKNNLKIPKFLIIQRLLSKLPQFIKK